MPVPFSPGPRVYNLFPRLVGGMEGWISHFARIKAMGFDWVYVNPFHFPGYSGSLYAVKDYDAFNPLFVDDNRPLSHAEQFREMLDACHAAGLRFMMDLVVSHTAFDAVLAAEHPEFFAKDPETGELKHPGAFEGEAWVEWGDLVQLDMLGSPEREKLWAFFTEMVGAYAAQGVDGFRCDAAYHVPAPFWRHLIAETKAQHPAARFFAETLGCRPAELIAMADAGFDCVFNSVCWWDYEADWFPLAHHRVCGAAPSIGFPESHDTARVAAETGGHEGLARQRFAFAALFGAGVLMPIGFEYGFERKLDVVSTRPEDWEAPRYDLSGFVAETLALKARHRVFNVDGPIQAIETYNPKVKAYLKRTPDARQKALFILSLDPDEWQEVSIPSIVDALGADAVVDVSLAHRWEAIGKDFTGRVAPACCHVLLGLTGAEAAEQVPAGVPAEA